MSDLERKEGNVSDDDVPVTKRLARPVAVKHRRARRPFPKTRKAGTRPAFLPP
jgi:hypothetical protein